MSTVAVLGVGGVGGALAVRLAHAGMRVICIARPKTVAAIKHGGLQLNWSGSGASGPGSQVIEAWPEARDRLDELADLLLVTVKAPDLPEALLRIDEQPLVVMPLLNGLEHPVALRRRFGGRVAPGSIRIEARAWVVDLGPEVSPHAGVHQYSPFTIVRVASDDLTVAELDGAADFLRRAMIETHVESSEKTVLWEKAARLAVLAPATALTQRPVGDLRADPEWRPTMEAAIKDTCAIASADGASTTPEAQWEIIDSMPNNLSTSAARDIAAGAPSELDAITGAAIRAGKRLGVRCPALVELYDRCRAL